MKFKFYFLCFFTFFLLNTSVDSKVKIFACEPEWASLSEEIGGNLVDVYSATNEFQDPHYVKAKPSLIAKVRKADFLFCTGSSLEVGWLPVLLEKSGNSKIQPGQLGHFLATDSIDLKQKNVGADRSMGDVHPEGNPHIHLNPYYIAKVAKLFSERLQKIAPSKANTFKQNETSFLKKWNNTITSWETKAKSLQNMKIITYHATWFYLMDWLKIEVVDKIEIKPGIKPTAKHLKSLIDKAKSNSVKGIIRTPFDSAKSSKWLTKKTKIPNKVITYTVGKNSKDLFSLFDNILKELLTLKG